MYSHYTHFLGSLSLSFPSFAHAAYYLFDAVTFALAELPRDRGDKTHVRGGCAHAHSYIPVQPKDAGVISM